MSIKPPVTSLFVLKTSQEIVLDIAQTIKTKHPDTFTQLQPAFLLVYDALSIGITRIEELHTDLEAATKPKH